ncbi:MAG: hypothetical protein ACRCYD_05545 [Plesiomonas sp.]
MAKVTMYRGEGFTSNEAFIAVSGERMKTPETFGNISDWQWGKLCITPDWFRDQLVPDNVVWEADL